MDLFDDEMNPIFPDDEGRRAEKILQWIVDSIHHYHTIDPNSLTIKLIRKNITAGRQTFALINKYDLKWVNNHRNAAAVEVELQGHSIPATQSQHAKIFNMAPLPTLEHGQQNTLK